MIFLRVHLKDPPPVQGLKGAGVAGALVSQYAPGKIIIFLFSAIWEIALLQFGQLLERCRLWLLEDGPGHSLGARRTGKGALKEKNQGEKRVYKNNCPIGFCYSFVAANTRYL